MHGLWLVKTDAEYRALLMPHGQLGLFVGCFLVKCCQRGGHLACSVLVCADGAQHVVSRAYMPQPEEDKLVLMGCMSVLLP